MKLSEFDFKNAEDMGKPFQELLKEATARTPKKGIEKFSEFFYQGGTPNFQKDVEGTWKEDAWKYARMLMSSWNPKHEHKEIVCGMIFEETLVL